MLTRKITNRFAINAAMTAFIYTALDYGKDYESIPLLVVAACLALALAGLLALVFDYLLDTGVSRLRDYRVEMAGAIFGALITIPIHYLAVLMLGALK